MMRSLVYIFLFFPMFVSASTSFTVGSEFEYNGATYRVGYSRDGQCDTGVTVLTHVAHQSGNVFSAPTDVAAGCDTRYYRAYAYITADVVSDQPCDAASTGLCYQNLCDGYPTIDGVPYINTGETDMEVCQWNTDGTATGNIWKDAAACSAPTGACLRENNCTASAGFTIMDTVLSAAECSVSRINSELNSDTSYVLIDVVWQECDSHCYGKVAPIDCASKTPYSPTLSEGETIYSSDLTLEECIQYSNSQNFDARFETYSSGEAPGFSCQNLSFCIVKDRPHSCQGVDTPLPSVSSGETYFTVGSESECITYASNYNVEVRFKHFDDKDNAGRSCYDVNYCIQLLSSVDSNTTGGTTSSSENNTTTPDNTGSHAGTGSTAVDLNGTNDRLDIIDGHIKDGNQVNRQGFDRNHDDLNRLSQNIKDGTEANTRSINGLTHSIGTILDHLKNGEINSTGSAFDDTGIIAANNATTTSVNSLNQYLRGDANGSMSDLNLTDLGLDKLTNELSEFTSAVDDLNLSKEDLSHKIETEITEQMQDFQDKSTDTVTTALDDILSTLFNPFKPFIDVGQNIGNFKTIKLPIVVSSVGYQGEITMTSSQVFGQSGSSLAYFFEILRILLSFIAVLAGFFYLVEGVSRG